MYKDSEQIAWQRGRDRGLVDESQDYYDDAILSGEWAGYSHNELLGDLFPTSDVNNWLHPASYYRVIDDICDAYTDGYNSAFAGRAWCDECGTLVNPNDGVTDDVFVYCGSMFGNGCAEKMVAS